MPPLFCKLVNFRIFNKLDKIVYQTNLDFILLDVKMPGLIGIEICKKLKEKKTDKAYIYHHSGNVVIIEKKWYYLFYSVKLSYPNS